MVFFILIFRGCGMNAYEKMLMIMREQGKRENPDTPKMAEMASDSTVKMGSLFLDEEDLLVNSNLKGKLEKGDTVLIQKVSEDTYVILAKVVEM